MQNVKFIITQIHKDLNNHGYILEITVAVAYYIVFALLLVLFSFVSTNFLSLLLLHHQFFPST